MGLLAFGINHKSASVALRERVSFAPEVLPSALMAACQATGLRELALISTCNRTEFYAASDAPEAAAVALLDWLAKHQQLPSPELSAVAYNFTAEKAVQHAMRVAAGLDSMILGEPQILGQMKQAHRDAMAAGTLGPELERLFQKTFAAAKQVRTETAIGVSPVSIGFAAVNLAKQVFESLQDTRVLLVGAGEMNTLVARHLREQGVTELLLVNRTLANAEALAQSVQGQALPWSSLDSALARADMVVSCTASTQAVITRELVVQALKRRRHRPLLLIDIAVPRDVAPEVAELEDVYLYTVDDLQGVVDAGWRERQRAAEVAEVLISEHVKAFAVQQRILQDGAHWIRRLRQQAASVADIEREKALDALRKGGDAEVVLARLQHNLMNKWLHAPTVALRQLASEDNAQQLPVALRVMGLNQEDNGA